MLGMIWEYRIFHTQSNVAKPPTGLFLRTIFLENQGLDIVPRSLLCKHTQKDKLTYTLEHHVSLPVDIPSSLLEMSERLEYEGGGNLPF